jgi:nucleotide-binding universal stress UspA family protein
MLRILIPVLDSLNALPAVRHTAREFRRGERIEVHLLHVRTLLSLEIARWVSGSDAVPSHREAAENVLAPVRTLLDTLHIRHAIHLEDGDKAPMIVKTAGRLKVDRIVLGAARDRSLTRYVEDSVIDKVLDFAPVPVDLVVGKSVSPLERFGLPAGLGASLGLLALASVE